MKKLKKTLSIVLAFVLVFSCVQIATVASAEQNKQISSMNFAAISDIHYYPESMYTEKDAKKDPSLVDLSGGLLDTAIKTLVDRSLNSGLKYVLVPGDLTKNSEYAAHVELAAKLEKYEKEYGIEFLVINGNHDINLSDAASLKDGKETQERAITPDEFKTVYANLGYDLAVSEFSDSHGKQAGYLSYMAKLDDGYSIVVVDAGIYSFDEPQKMETAGEISDELMSWIETETKSAQAQGDVVMLMLHQAVAAHNVIAPSVTQDFVVRDYIQVAEKLASLGINFAFTGHYHTDDIARVVNDDGQVIYDCETASISAYPNTYREMTISTYDDGVSYVDYNSIDFDANANYVKNGVTYDNSSYKNESFGLLFGGVNDKGEVVADATLILAESAEYFLDPIVDSIKENGGVRQMMIENFDFDLEAFLADFLQPYLGDGINIAGYKLFSTENIIWFIDDLLSQFEKEYLEDPEVLYDFISDTIAKLMDYKISDYAPQNFKELGVGVNHDYGTIGDLVLTAVAYSYTGDENAHDDEFLNDVYANLENSSIMRGLVPYLLDVVVNDVAQDALLSKLDLRVDKLLNDDWMMNHLGEGVNYLLNKLLRNDKSYLNLVKVVLATGILPYTSIQDVLDKLVLDKYLTDSVFESIGMYATYALKGFTTDENPIECGDLDVTYNNEKVAVEATQENYRKPTMVSVTMGEDSQTQADLRWYSKYSLGGDIEIYKSDSQPQFSGTAQASDGIIIEKQSETVERSFPGVDLGFFGFLDYSFMINMHSVEISGLEADSTYYYRVGDAEHGWWSETGTITTSSGGDEVTFLHMTDPQSQNKAQYDAAWKKVVDTAFNLHPDADFIINTGDIVDTGDNLNQWQAVLDTAAPDLMNTFMMPVSGNHEGYGENSIANHFVLSQCEEQDTTSGMYYSFEYNNVYFAVLNTNALNADDTISDEQINWLKEDIAKTDATWKFVAFHKAVYSQGSHFKDSDVEAMRAQLSVLMPQLDIDMVFQGHDHVYLRTNSLIDNKLEGNDKVMLEFEGKDYITQVMPEGTSYVITGTSGIKFYDKSSDYVDGEAFPRPAAIMELDLPMFAAIQIKDQVMYFDAYAVEDSVANNVDSFAIQKDTTQGNYVGDVEDEDPTTSSNAFKDFLKKFIEAINKIITVVINIIKLYVFEMPV